MERYLSSQIKCDNYLTVSRLPFMASNTGPTEQKDGTKSRFGGSASVRIPGLAN
jgi:hypothetical protein